MSEQTRVDPEALREVGRVFGESGRSIEVAATALAGCTFADHMGARYGGHALDYAAGILAVSQSMARFAGATHRFGDGLIRSADDLSGEDSTSAETFRGADRGTADG